MSRHIRRAHTVQEAVRLRTWATDLGPDLTADVLHQFFELWTAMDTVQLDQDSTDKVVWS